MNDNNTNIEEISAEEQLYTDTKVVLESMSCMAVTEEKVKLYKSLSKDFKSLGDYEDAKALASRCDALAKETKSKVNEIKLNKAEEYLKNSQSAEELHKADKLLKELKDYKNAKELREQCEVASEKLAKKRRTKLYITYAVIVALIGLFIFSRTDFFHYQVASVLKSTGHYGRAASMFGELDTYKDSEQLAIESNYEAGKTIMSKEHLVLKSYQKAKNAFVRAKGYKDSAQWIATIEQGLLKCKKVGDKINFGDSKWIVVDMQEDKALVVKCDGITDLAYSNKEGAATWENSSLREYLNTTFLNDAFTKEEQANMADTTVVTADNASYGTDGGKDTIDKIFILSAEEQAKYMTVLGKHSNNSWLRTPGASENSAAFLNSKGIIMDYGYQADSFELLTVPAFWYKY